LGKNQRGFGVQVFYGFLGIEQDSSYDYVLMAYLDSAGYTSVHGLIRARLVSQIPRQHREKILWWVRESDKERRWPNNVSPFERPWLL